MNSLYHSKTSTVQPLKFRNAQIISFHTLLDMWLLIHSIHGSTIGLESRWYVPWSPDELALCTIMKFISIPDVHNEMVALSFALYRVYTHNAELSGCRSIHKNIIVNTTTRQGQFEKHGLYWPESTLVCTGVYTCKCLTPNIIANIK